MSIESDASDNAITNALRAGNTLWDSKDDHDMSASQFLKSPKKRIRNQRVRWGDLVQVDFMAWLEDGTLLDSTLFKTPLVFRTGKHAVIRGVERLVIGMSAGESKTEQIPPELAYGCYRPELIFHVGRNWLTRHAIVPTVGMKLAISKDKATLLRVVVTDFTDEQVTLDANHLLAGKTITVQLELLEIVSRSRLAPPSHITKRLKKGT